LNFRAKPFSVSRRLAKYYWLNEYINLLVLVYNKYTSDGLIVVFSYTSTTTFISTFEYDIAIGAVP
jgi:hypothetical protein